MTRVKVGGAEISAFRGPGLSWAGGAVVQPEADGTISLRLLAASVPVTVTEEPWASRGTWPVVVLVSSLTAAPVNLVRPEISGGASIGDVLTVTPGLWVYDESMGEPVLSYQWRRNGVIIAGAAAANYTLVAANAGCTLTVVETATSGSASASVVSPGVSIPSASMSASGGAGLITVTAFGGVPTLSASGGAGSITINSWG